MPRCTLFIFVLVGLIGLTNGCKAKEPSSSSGDAYLRSGIEKYKAGQKQQGIEDIRTAREIYQREKLTDRVHVLDETLDKIEQSTPLPSPQLDNLDNRDLGFLRATQDASGWSAWGNSNDQQKIETGRIACQKIASSSGNLQDASQNLIFAHGGDPRNFSDLAGASIVVGQAVEYYCPEMRPALAEWMRRANQPPPFPRYSPRLPNF